MPRSLTLVLLLLAAPMAVVGAPASPVAPLTNAETLEVRLVELMAIDYRRGRRLPDWVQALDGRRVRIEGYMAIGTPEGDERFELVWDSCGCGTSQPHHFVQVTVPEGESTRFDPELIAVEGRFAVGEEIEDGFVKSLFRLKAESIEELAE